MAWARLDDGWHDHPKTVAAGPEAAGVWAMCLTWAYRQRKKSAHPGVVPDDVVKRFAGRRMSQITRRLHEVRYFDDHTEYGWPIHDFADYLPNYDPQQAAEAGRLGGRVKRNGSEPLSGTEANRLAERKRTASEPEADAKQTEPSRASARRNPTKRTSSLRSSGGAGSEPLSEPLSEPQANVGAIVGAWVEAATEVQGDRPSSQLVARVGKQVKALVSEGKDPARLEAAARSAGAKGWDDIGRELLRLGAVHRAPSEAIEHTWGSAAE